MRGSYERWIRGVVKGVLGALLHSALRCSVQQSAFISVLITGAGREEHIGGLLDPQIASSLWSVSIYLSFRVAARWFGSHA